MIVSCTKARSYMIPAVELMAIHNNPTESVFNIRIRYSLTPGSTFDWFLYWQCYKLGKELFNGKPLHQKFNRSSGCWWLPVSEYDQIVPVSDHCRNNRWDLPEYPACVLHSGNGVRYFFLNCPHNQSLPLF